MESLSISNDTIVPGKYPLGCLMGGEEMARSTVEPPGMAMRRRSRRSWRLSGRHALRIWTLGIGTEIGADGTKTLLVHLHVLFEGVQEAFGMKRGG